MGFGVHDVSPSHFPVAEHKGWSWEGLAKAHGSGSCLLKPALHSSPAERINPHPSNFLGCSMSWHLRHFFSSSGALSGPSEELGVIRQDSCAQNRIKAIPQPARVPRRGHRVLQKQFTCPSLCSHTAPGLPKLCGKKIPPSSGPCIWQAAPAPGRSVRAGKLGAHTVPAARPWPDHPTTSPLPIQDGSEPALVSPAMAHWSLPSQSARPPRLCNSGCRFLRAIEVTARSMEITGDTRQQ